MLIPQKLKIGDTIGIVSPSCAITRDSMMQFDEGVRFLKEMGFKVKYGKNIFNIDDYSAGTPQERADDINSMFGDNEIKAIICSQGGENANSCLPYIDYELVKRNPKIFLGISDITVLLLALNKKTELVTFHGNDVMWGFGINRTEYDEKEFENRLVNGEIGEIKKNTERKTIRNGIAEGILIGGNINCMMKLAGTDYFPDFKDSILFLEAYTITPADCDCKFHQLKQLGVFDNIKGVIIGYIYGLQFTEEKLTQMEDILIKVTKEYDFPILKVNDFGHCCPNTILPIGSKIKIDATNCKVEILEKCVE